MQSATLSIDINPHDIECVVFDNEGVTSVFAAYDNTKNLNNFTTNTPVDAIRSAFMKSTAFIDAAIDQKIAYAGKPDLKDVRAFINLRHIKSLHVFEDGLTWITLKSGGEVNDVVFDEGKLANLLKRAGLVVQEFNRRDEVEGRVFVLPEDHVTLTPEHQTYTPVEVIYKPIDIIPVRTHDAAIPSIKPEFTKSCHICGRTSPCAAKNCGLKEPQSQMQGPTPTP